MSIEVRLFRRGDREQVTGLVNAHVAAVVPGISVSVNRVMAQLEREPGEFIVDPWVVERTTLVAEQRQRVVAAAHLLRYGTEPTVSDSYRGLGEIRWFLFWPGASYWPDAARAGEELLAACLGRLERWGVSRQGADGALPAPGVYGIPAQWPHIRSTLERAGFRHEGRVELILLADLTTFAPPGPAPIGGLTLDRTLGSNGTRLSALLDGEPVGYIEVDTLEPSDRLPRVGGWADIGNLEIGERHRRRGLATWLLAHAADWLRLAHVDRLLAYAWPDQGDCIAFLERGGFRELTRTQRGWLRHEKGPHDAGL
jgi:GNAT superfamily N-acetyltransferase